MALKDSLEKSRYKQNQFCPFQRLINNLNAEDVKALNEALAEKYPDVTIARALRNEGHRIAEISVMEHRKGICRCPKTQNSKKS